MNPLRAREPWERSSGSVAFFCIAVSMFLVAKPQAPGHQGLAHVIRVGDVQYCIAKQNHRLFVLSNKRTLKRSIPGLHDDAFPNPLPELRLGRPEFLPV